MDDFSRSLSVALKAAKGPICRDFANRAGEQTLDDEGEKELTEGKINVMLESLEGSRARRDMYMLTVVPGLAKKGVAIGQVLESMAFWNASCTAHVITHIPEDHRDSARLWMAEFFARYTEEFMEAFMRDANAVVAPR